ncbi:hypothetical protein [Nonomuraea endophytica]|uniref:Uncharacterized protein n=1 Tax=Nonomuraea endophytica TaxID=714136 RepID=A0A7W8A3S5_9ACTN|nr:hypothetical protein [Nonomuraea endophytica]MBB5079005.1 hypothetical protein [Nonomuraea endophytica]
MSELRRHYTYLPEQGSVAWIRTTDFDGMVRTLGGDPAWVYPATWADVESVAWELADDEGQGVVLAARHGPWTVVLDAIRGRLTGRVKRLPVSGEALALQWTVNYVAYARDGQVVGSFDPADLDTISPLSGRAWLSGLPVTPEEWRQGWQPAALALGEALSGVRLDQDWLAREHLCVPLGTTRPEARRPSGFRVRDWLRPTLEGDPRLLAIAADPAPERQHEIIQIVIELARRAWPMSGDVERQALRAIADRVRDDRSARTRTQLDAAAADIRARIDATAAQIERQVSEERGPVQVPVVPDIDLMMRLSADPELDRLHRELRPLEILAQALDPDLNAAATQTSALLTGNWIPPEMSPAQAVLQQLAWYVATGEVDDE